MKKLLILMLGLTSFECDKTAIEEELLTGIGVIIYDQDHNACIYQIKIINVLGSCYDLVYSDDQVIESFTFGELQGIALDNEQNVIVYYKKNEENDRKRKIIHLG